MKPTLYILFLLVTQTVLGQITYEPIFINPCTNQVEENVLWYVVDSDSAYVPDYKKSKGISLPKLGEYSLVLNFDEEFIKFEILDKTIRRDTFLLKRVKHGIYISNPPHSEYLDCDSPANGEIVDFYRNGNKRMQGVFKNGQPVDSLFRYYRNGQLSEVFIPKKDKWKSNSYFENGQLKSVYDTKKRFEKEYYENGQLKNEKSWSKKYRVIATEYYPNGVVHKKRNHKNLEVFDTNGNLVEKVKRRRRLYLFDSYMRNRKYYKYKWKTFAKNGTLQRDIVFESEGFTISPFPDSIQQIKTLSFEKVTFFENGKEAKKLEIDYVLENDQFEWKLLIYRKEEDEWIKEKETMTDDIYKIIAAYSK